LKKQDVRIILYSSGAKGVCRQRFVVAATPPPEFVQSDTKQEAALDIACKNKPTVSSTGGVRKSSRKTKPVVKQLQVTRKGRNRDVSASLPIQQSRNQSISRQLNMWASLVMISPRQQPTISSSAIVQNVCCSATPFCATTTYLEYSLSLATDNRFG
jgi:hypothetical protein